MLKRTYSILCACLMGLNPILTLNAFESDSVIELNDSQFEDFIQKSDKPLILDFWAPWCPPCREMKPVFEELANEFKEQYVFIGVNIEEGKQIAEKYGVKRLPTFKVIKNNTVIGTFTGCMDKQTFMEKVENVLHGKFSQSTLFSAVQAGDKELVRAHLSHKNIDANEITHMEAANYRIPMTPLMMAVSGVFAGQYSSDMVSLLLNAGADIHLEFDFPEFDPSGTVIGWRKTSVLSEVENAAKDRSEEFSAMDEMFLQRLKEYQIKASQLLKLFQESAGK